MMTLPPVPVIITEQSEEDWGRLNKNTRYTLINNVWNKGAIQGAFRQDIFIAEEGFGWRWDVKNRGYDVITYPEVLYGVKPWNPEGGTQTEFPVPAGSADITASFDIELQSKGRYNMAFSIWAVSALPTSEETISHEIMIWNAHNNLKPAGKKHDEIQIDGITYDVYRRENHGDASGESAHIWKYIAFSPHTNILQGSIPLDAFVDYLIEEKIMAESTWLSGVELGNEIVRGRGYAVIKDYSISVTPR